MTGAALPRRMAIDLALEASSRPEAAAFAGVAPLPDGLKTVLRIVAEGEWRDPATHEAYARHDARAVREACAAFLVATLFRSTEDPYRVLGLTARAPAQDVREHKRLLLKWLHPDRNPDQRQQGLLKLVVEAADQIEQGTAGRKRAQGATGETRRAVTPPVTGRQHRGGKARAATPQPGQLRRAAAEALDLALSGLRRAAWSAAAVIAALVAWRIVMHEPIGQSMQRYSEAALGLMKW